MFRTSHILLAVSLASLPVLAASAAQTHVAPGSVWKLNLAESNFGGGPSMKSDEFVVLVDNAKWLKWTDTMVDGDGKTWKMSFDGPADGSMHPMTGVPGMMFGENAADDTSVEKMPDGTSFSCSFSTSANKKKYYEKCTVATKDGKKFMQNVVYDRVK
jgi:hypothetical protein